MMTDLLNMKKLVPGGTCPVMVTKIHPQIQKDNQIQQVIVILCALNLIWMTRNLMAD